MTVKVEQFLAQVTYDLHLFEQDAIESPSVDFDIAAWFVNFVEQGHFFLNYAHDLINVSAMRVDQLLFLL